MSTRRDFVRGALAGAVGLSLCSRAFGQAAESIVATRLSPTLVLLTGNGGNVAVVVGDAGLLMVDGGLPDRSGELAQSLAAVSSRPVTVLFNTHWHFDHVGSNERLGKAGARIVGHENTRKHLAAGATLEAMKMKFEPMPPHAVPAQTFTSRGSLAFGKETIEYIPVEPAHTDGDAFVFLPGQNVLHTGDLFFRDMYPFIDYSTGGWIGGMVAAADTMYKACDASTRIIPGHGPLSTRDDLKRSRDMLATVHERLAGLAKRGLSADEVVKQMPNKDFDGLWGKGFMNPETFARVAYTSLLRHNDRR